MWPATDVRWDSRQYSAGKKLAAFGLLGVTSEDTRSQNTKLTPAMGVTCCSNPLSVAPVAGAICCLGNCVT